MSKLVFYGAISLDGYLARENHSLDWLFGTEGEEETGYQEFYDSVDTILMGRSTMNRLPFFHLKNSHMRVRHAMFSRVP